MAGIGGMLAALGAAGRERDAAQHLGKARRSQRAEALARRKGGGRHVVGDRHQLVGVGALVAVSADRRGDAPDGDGAVAVEAAGDVAQAVGGGRPWLAGRRIGAGGDEAVDGAVWPGLPDQEKPRSN